METESQTKEPSVTRRKLLKTGAAGALGAAAATAITATPASAADGDLLILGRENEASSPTRITLMVLSEPTRSLPPREDRLADRHEGNGRTQILHRGQQIDDPFRICGF
jgi:hypothetical protein